MSALKLSLTHIRYAASCSILACEARLSPDNRSHYTQELLQVMRDTMDSSKQCCVEYTLKSSLLVLAKGAFVWDQSGIGIIGIMRVSVCLGAILIPEYLDFHSSYSAPRSRIAGINSGIYSYSRISQTNAP